VYVPLDPAKPSLAAVISAPNQPARTLTAQVMETSSAILPGAAPSIYPVERLFIRDVGEYQFQGPIVAVLGALALVLAAVGLYGVVTYLVEQRLREFGVRLALGARQGDIWSSVMRQSLVPTIAGLAAGLGVAVGTSRFLRSLLFGVEPNSPWVMATVVATLGLAALVATVRPARRAMRVDPVSILRAN
jgi:ABC-type antimicrobial peptide transport system permease subunit